MSFVGAGLYLAVAWLPFVLMTSYDKGISLKPDLQTVINKRQRLLNQLGR